jgi:hypothetical protein
MPSIPRELHFVCTLTSVFCQEMHQMFDQLVNHHAPERAACSPVSRQDLVGDDLLAAIVARLQREVPQKPYLPDQWLAETLGIEPKTLMNRRSQKRGQYPTPMHIAGSQGGLHVREEIIVWLAGEELRARTRRIHKCV